MSLIMLLTLLHVVLCYSQSTFSPLRPPAIPLAVKSPYLSTWLRAGSNGGNGGYLPGEWATHWSGEVKVWTGMIRVDNETYTWMGSPNENKNYAEQTAYEYTSTKSVFTLSVGDMVEMTVTFLSPITPNDLLRSSLPYSYMDVAVRSMDGKGHDVQLYSDISAEWVSGDRAATAEWEYGITGEDTQIQKYANTPTPDWPSTTQMTIYGTETSYVLQTSVAHTFEPAYDSSEGYQPSEQQPRALKRRDHRHSTRQGYKHLGSVAYHRIWRQQQLQFLETTQQADWGYWYYATQRSEDLTYQSGADYDVRSQFVRRGELSNTEDSEYRAINDRYPIFGFSIDLGEVTSHRISTVFQISLHQDDCVQFGGEHGLQSVPCLWMSYFDKEASAVGYFYNDYQAGNDLADAFDNKVERDSINAGGKDYLSLTSLAARQAFGALEYTNCPETPWVFMKEISSNGNTQTVDVIFPFHPIALYMNAKLLKYILDPLFINQEAGHWPFAFSIHDLGYHFPNATGHDDGKDEMQPLGECGNMIIMALAYAQRTGDDAYLAQQYDILRQWKEYLVNDSLVPMNQISTDDFAGSLANQTNLALKGIIGIKAMAEIAHRTGREHDRQNFTDISRQYLNKWMDRAVAGPSGKLNKPHTSLSYGANDTFSLLYNLYADKELGLECIPQSIYDMQSEFYPTVFNKYGAPLDTRHNYTKADWEMFAASVASEDTRNLFISTLARWLNETPTSFAFTDLDATGSGDYPPSGITFIARPVVGAIFALLALDSAPTS